MFKSRIISAFTFFGLAPALGLSALALAGPPSDKGGSNTHKDARGVFVRGFGDNLASQMTQAERNRLESNGFEVIIKCALYDQSGTQVGYTYTLQNKLGQNETVFELTDGDTKGFLRIRHPDGIGSPLGFLYPLALDEIPRATTVAGSYVGQGVLASDEFNLFYSADTVNDPASDTVNSSIVEASGGLSKAVGASQRCVYVMDLTFTVKKCLSCLYFIRFG